MGRPVRHGRELKLSDDAGCPRPDVHTTTQTSRYGAADARAWHRMHPRLKARGAWDGHQGDLPVIEGTLIKLTVDHLPHDHHPKPVWLWTFRPDADPAEVNRCWQAFLRRFDIEHTFRFLKQALGWTRPRLRDPAAADRWTWLILAACTQLWIARGIAADLRLPWQRPSLGPVGSNLEEPNSFVGRERELGELRRLAASARAVTLCGPGGIGKTRLALRVLAELGEEFPDGVWFVELGDLRQPELVVSRVASVIGVDEEPGRPLLETLADALRPRQAAAALDNCEHLIDSCARLCHRLLASSPGLHVLATSREPLRMAAEAVWQVPPLSLPPPGAAGPPDELCRYEAVRLFADRAEASLPGFAVDRPTCPRWLRLCRSLDGVPLAIELAAAWVRVLSVEQIVTRLDDRFRLLTSGDRTAPPRQRTLRAAIDWSHDLLARREQVLLRRLSVFAGWSLEMAEQICPGGDLPARPTSSTCWPRWRTSRWSRSTPRPAARPGTGCSTPSGSTRPPGWPRPARPR